MSDNPLQKARKAAKANRGSQGDYDVGYGKPPAQHRFQKGHKPKNRQRTAKAPSADEDVVTRLLGTKIPVVENGKTKHMTIEEAMMHGLLQKALKGDLRAIKTALSIKALMAKVEAKRVPTEEEIREKIEQEKVAKEASDKFHEMLCNILDDYAEWKRMGIFDDETGDFAHWVHEEAWRRQHGDPEFCKRNYITYIPYKPVGMDLTSKDQQLIRQSELKEDR